MALPPPYLFASVVLMSRANGCRQGGRSAEEGVQARYAPRHGAQFGARGPRPTPQCGGEFYASTLTRAHDRTGLSMIEQGSRAPAAPFLSQSPP